MRFAMVCASHTPLLMKEQFASSSICDQVALSFRRMAGFIDEFRPDQIIQFSPDHYHGFHYDNMPPFCLGTAARSYGDWGTGDGQLNVDENFALDVLDGVRAADIDLSVSYDMVVDHGFVQIWEAMWGDFTRYPIVPIFVNAISPPLPTYRRARMLGEAVGRRVATSGKRILFVASGGLSHDPVVPKIQGASPELRNRLLGLAHFGPEQQARRERQVEEAARAAMLGKGPSRPLNPGWDRAFMDIIAKGDWTSIDGFTAEGVDAAAGAGGNEVLCWVAAAAALSTAGPYHVVQHDYVDIPGWIAGLGHMSAVSLAAGGPERAAIGGGVMSEGIYTPAGVGKSVRAFELQTNYLEAGSEHTGDGEPITLLHGSGPGVSAWTNWRRVLPALADRWQVFAPDMAGFGYTERRDDFIYDIKLWVKHLLGFMDALGIEKAHLVGNSFGGSLALAAALRFPERFGRLVLMGTPCGKFAMTPGLKAGWNYEPSLEQMRAVMALFPYDAAIISEELVRERYDTSLIPGAQQGLRKLLVKPSDVGETPLSGMPEDAVAKLAHPTLILHGREDRVIPVELGLRLAQNIPNAEFHLFGRCGHWVQAERFDSFMALTRRHFS